MSRNHRRVWTLLQSQALFLKNTGYLIFEIATDTERATVGIVVEFEM